MRKTQATPEHISVMIALLKDVRSEQVKGNELLNDLRLDVSSLAKAHEGQQQALSHLREHVSALDGRLHKAELQIAKLPAVESSCAQVATHHQTLDGRVRTLENSSSAQHVVTGGLRDIWRYVIAVVIGAALAAGSSTISTLTH